MAIPPRANWIETWILNLYHETNPGARTFPSLPTFTFRQVGVKAMEIQAVPGSEVPPLAGLHGKIMRHESFLGPGGQADLSPKTWIFRCRGAQPGARAARPILRKPRRISGWNSFPADAFSVQRPCFRAWQFPAFN